MSRSRVPCHAPHELIAEPKRRLAPPPDYNPAVLRQYRSVHCNKTTPAGLDTEQFDQLLSRKMQHTTRTPPARSTLIEHAALYEIVRGRRCWDHVASNHRNGDQTTLLPLYMAGHLGDSSIIYQLRAMLHISRRPRSCCAFTACLAPACLRL